jgi:hypothetical protein
MKEIIKLSDILKCPEGLIVKNKEELDKLKNVEIVENNKPVVNNKKKKTKYYIENGVLVEDDKENIFDKAIRVGVSELIEDEQKELCLLVVHSYIGNVSQTIIFLSLISFFPFNIHTTLIGCSFAILLSFFTVCLKLTDNLFYKFIKRNKNKMVKMIEHNSIHDLSIGNEYILMLRESPTTEISVNIELESAYYVKSEFETIFEIVGRILENNKKINLYINKSKINKKNNKISIYEYSLKKNRIIADTIEEIEQIKEERRKELLENRKKKEEAKRLKKEKRKQNGNKNGNK